MHMGCSPTETKPPRQGPSKPPSALEHPSPEFQPREGHGWLMQQLLPPEPSMVPWALARTGHPTGVRHPHTPPHKPRALVLSLGPETKSQTPVGSQKHKSHLHPTAHSPHSIPHRKGHGGGGGGAGEPTPACFTHPMPGSGCSPEAAPTDPSPSAQFSGATSGAARLPPPPRQRHQLGCTYKYGQVEEDHHDLDKGEAPHLCTWGEQKGYQGDSPPRHDPCPPASGA